MQNLRLVCGAGRRVPNSNFLGGRARAVYLSLAPPPLGYYYLSVKKVLITGSGGLIGSEAVRFFAARGFETYGIDNDLRSYFFGAVASTKWNLERLKDEIPTYRHFSVDIRTPPALTEIFQEHQFDLVIHTAAQPSHDWAAKEPITDFGINAYGTLLLLEKCRKFCPEAVFIFTSTNKVYGDRPNTLPLIELTTRYELPPEHRYYQGIDESMSLDDSLHSLMGASKVSADIMVQEYGKYFGLKTGVFRGGCLTGPAHSGTQLHGFLAYLIKCLATGEPYTIFGYKGKQVRDNIHSYDLINAFYHFYQNPHPGEAYNIGGSRHAHTSILEAVQKIEAILGRKANLTYIDQPRKGDHIWYISDIAKFKNHYPDWRYEYTLERTLEEICYSGHFASAASGASTISFFKKDPQLTKAKLSKVFLAGHVDKAFGPIQALRVYLSSASEGLVYAEHSLFKTSHHLLTVFKDSYLNLRWFYQNREGLKIFLGVNNVNAFSGVILKKLGFNFMLIYYAIDYSPQRFANPLINKVFHLADRICTQQADYVWSSTPEIQEIRRQQGLSISKNILVRSGVLARNEDNRLAKPRTSLVINGFLSREPLVRLALKNLKRLQDQFPEANLHVIVGYLNQANLEGYVQELGLGSKVSFWDKIPHQKIASIYAACGVGLGLFQVSADCPALYHDPLEIKEFLAAGLPVVCSQGVALAREVLEQEAGVVISNTEDELYHALVSLLSDEVKYQHLSQKALEYTHHLSWEEILDQAFRESGNE